MAKQGSVQPKQADVLRSELQSCVLACVGRRIPDLRIEADDNHCILHGHAPSYYVKQLAQAAVLRKFRFRELRNQIVVGLTELEGERACWY